jgi:hypothetical protein
MPEGWSMIEAEATVADYLAMLKKELRGLPYNKSEHRRALALRVKRSHLAIDRKHMNVSAILGELGYPWIDGYKPFSNYQNLLREIVVSQVAMDDELNALAEAVATAVPTAEEVPDLLGTLVSPPEPLPKAPKAASANGPPPGTLNRNYLEQEARNSALGRAGEEFVLRYERSRLLSLGLDRFADRLVHVAVTVGDGAGFDIRSFEGNGSDRLIEVKTTNFGSRTPFFVTANELNVSKRHSGKYHLYRLFHFRKSPKQYQVQGALDGSFSLNATVFRASR